jgi:hypothetical protein
MTRLVRCSTCGHEQSQELVRPGLWSARQCRRCSSGMLYTDTGVRAGDNRPADTGNCAESFVATTRTTRIVRAA